MARIQVIKQIEFYVIFLFMSSFSPDHQWLLLHELASNDIWMRPVVEVGGEWRLLAG
jgi:hypothetical protein